MEKDTFSARAILKAADFFRMLPDRILQYRLWTAFIFIGITAGVGVGVLDFRVNQAMEEFFQPDDPAMMRYKWFRYVFGSDDYLMVMYTPKTGEVFTPENLKTVSKIEAELNRLRMDNTNPLSRMTQVRTIITAEYLESRDEQLISRPFIGETLPKTPKESQRLKKIALSHPDYPGAYISKDGSHAIFMLETDFGSRLKDWAQKAASQDLLSTGDEFDFGDDEKTLEAISIAEVPPLEPVSIELYGDFVNEVRRVFAQSYWETSQNSFFAGNPWVMDFFNTVILDEIKLYAGLSLIVIWIVLLLAFRSFAALVWPSVSLLCAVVWTIGLIGHTGVQMTFMINIVVFLLLAVSIATSIHILSGYVFFTNKGQTPIEALKNTYYKAGVPIFLAGLTTAFGMASLIFVPIKATQNFGVFASLGVCFTMIINIVMWPVFLSIWSPTIAAKSPTKGRIKKTSTGWLQSYLNHQPIRVEKHRKLIIASFIAFALFGLSGIPLAKIDTNFVEMVKPGYGLKESYQVIDRFFGGTAGVEILIDTGKQDGVKDSALLKDIAGFTRDIRNKFPDLVTRSKSIVNIVKDSHKNMMSGNQSDYVIPDTDATVSQVLFSFESADPKVRRKFVDDNWQVARLSLGLKTKGTHEYGVFMKEVKNLEEQYFSSYNNLEINHTGAVDTMVRLVDLISQTQIKSFALALSIICAIVLLLFGSWKVGMLAMIPNVFPLVLVTGLAGWVGIPFDSDTLLVIPIAIGIAVDDTIHFLTHYKHEMLQGKTSEQALGSALNKVGQAMVFTTAVLAIGFFVFVFSAYIPLTNFGILAAIAISSALFADLYLLPVLLNVWKPFSPAQPKAENLTPKKEVTYENKYA